VSGEPILIVDDNAINLKLVRLILESEQYSVATATDAQQALTVLEDFSPRVILMDLQLPEVDGLTLVRELRNNERWASTWIVALSADPGRKAQALAAGCDGYLTKPFDPDDFLRSLETFVASSRSEKSSLGEV
jgi:CheY-like chemotaxis protein